MRIIVHLKKITPIENFDNVVSYGHIPLVPLMQEQSEAELCDITSPAAGFDEGRPGVARRAAEGGERSRTTNMKIITDMCRLREPSAY